MSSLIPHLTRTQPLNEVLAWTTQQLNDVGLQVEQTFDLRAARFHHVGCACPNHGTDQCSCQMIVLIVCDEGNDPITLILHGSDGQTNLSLVNLSGKQSNLDLGTVVRQALTPPDVEAVEISHDSSDLSE